MSKHELEALTKNWREIAGSLALRGMDQPQYDKGKMLAYAACANELQAALTSPSDETPRGEVTDAALTWNALGELLGPLNFTEWRAKVTPASLHNDMHAVVAYILSSLPKPADVGKAGLSDLPRDALADDDFRWPDDAQA